MLSDKALAAIEQEKAKYPPERAQSAVMAALRIAQDELGWLSTDTMDYVAELLGMQPIQVYEVATFYHHYELKPIGRHRIDVCGSVSCWLCGSDRILDYFREKLGIEVGETTPDGRFTLREVECLGSCVGAPMMQIGNVYHENLTPAKIDEILDGLK
ncbi:NADH-quinone oxidoreductase subunit NuoE [Thermithiobacillus plumbiphilus]|uniref:NADH-quinone oxidoreductase subunit NuoE n=1 Tax=Thermithiobacillus plumbiphilus TaxID=1729899 RepID=A0ABU9DC51_9PROT